MMFAETKCKICGCKVVAKWENDAPQEAVDGWLPMLTCNRCFDLRVKRNESGSAIAHACFQLMHATKKAREKVDGEIRKVLEIATRSYAEAIQETFDAPEVIWSGVFVSALMDAPKEWQRILKEYRNEVRESAKRGIV